MWPAQRVSHVYEVYETHLAAACSASGWPTHAAQSAASRDPSAGVRALPGRVRASQAGNAASSSIFRKVRRRRRYGRPSRQLSRHADRAKRRAVLRWRWAWAAIVILALAGGAYWRFAHPPGARWEVLRLAGSPSVAGKAIGGAGRIGAGEWIETDARSRASVKVGEIGSVEVAPDTRLRVVTARRSEHRLALARGEIRAKISAPPKLFFVDTAAGTAVDLGCEYSLSTDERGSGLLNVTKGWVSFQWKGIESLVPAGASCRTRPARRTRHSVLRRRAGEFETGAGELRLRKSRRRRAGRHSFGIPRPRYADALALALARGCGRPGAGVRSHGRFDARPGRGFARAGT